MREILSFLDGNTNNTHQLGEAVFYLLLRRGLTQVKEQLGWGEHASPTHFDTLHSICKGGRKTSRASFSCMLVEIDHTKRLWGALISENGQGTRT